jgi:hypothetical protein
MLKVVGDRITYELSVLEKIGALSSSPSAEIAHLISVTREENPWSTKVLRGIRAPGTGFPYVIMLGTMWHRKGRDFCVIHKKLPVLVLEFKDEKFKRWAIPATHENENLLEKIKLIS